MTPWTNNSYWWIAWWNHLKQLNQWACDKEDTNSEIWMPHRHVQLAIRSVQATLLLFPEKYVCPSEFNLWSFGHKMSWINLHDSFRHFFGILSFYHNKLMNTWVMTKKCILVGHSDFNLWPLSAEISSSLRPIRPNLKNFHHGIPKPENIMPQKWVKLLEIQWTTNQDWPAFLSIEGCIVDKKFIVHKYLWRAATFLMSCSWPLIHY